MDVATGSSSGGGGSSSYTVAQEDTNFFLQAFVTYTDNRGGGKTAVAVTANRVFGENQRPTFPSTENGRRSIPENSRSGVSIGAPVAAEDPENDRLTYSLSGTDADAFAIVSSSGQLRTSEALNFEATETYSFSIDVHDGLDGAGNPSTTVDDTQDVTVTIENVEEPGTVTLVTDTPSIQARVEVTAELNDDDGPFSTSWQWSRSPNGRTDWVNISGARNQTYTPTLEADAGNYIRATARYSDGFGMSIETANAVSPRVGDPPPVNSPPAFPSTENGQREVAEDASGGDPVGVPRRGDRPERRRQRDGQQRAGLLANRDGRRVVHDRRRQRADHAGLGRGAGLRGQAQLPRHRAGHRRP